MTQDALLVIHAAGGDALVAVGTLDGSRTVLRAASHDGQAPALSSSRLVPMVEEALAELGGGTERLAAVGAVVGPGSFTGIKVGLAFAWGLAEGLGLPAVGVDALEVLAEAATGGTGVVHALVAGVRASVYEATFERREGRAEGERGGGLALLRPPRLATREEALADLDGPELVVFDGSGIRRGEEELRWWRAALGRLDVPLEEIDGAARAEAALRACMRRLGERPEGETLDALYLRRSWAEEAGEKTS